MTAILFVSSYHGFDNCDATDHIISVIFPIILSTSIWLLPSIRSPSCKQRLCPITGQDFRRQNLWFSITFENFSRRPIFVGRQKSADFFMTHDRFLSADIVGRQYRPIFICRVSWALAMQPYTAATGQMMAIPRSCCVTGLHLMFTVLQRLTMTLGNFTVFMRLL